MIRTEWVRHADSWHLLQAGIDYARRIESGVEEEWNPEITERFIKISLPSDINDAGFRWADVSWDDRLADRLFDWQDHHTLLWAGQDWPDSRWRDEHTDRFLEKAGAESICAMGERWPDHRWRPRAVDRLLKIGNVLWINRSVSQWKPERFDPRMVDYVVEHGAAGDLLLAGWLWPDYAWDFRVREKFLEKADSWHIEKAVREWPPGRLLLTAR